MTSSVNRKTFFLCLFLGAFSLYVQCTGGGHSPKFTQYYNRGEMLYEQHCSNCHQADGTGLGRVFPPLNKSDYMENNFEDVICLIRYGKTGEIMVNGIEFNQPMLGIPSLTDLEIAQIATYIYNTWEHQRGMVEVKEVTPILKNCERPDPL